ncbi:MAG TPA: prepilin-type N-terminal cleavage/methylation domain-containing protein, partial [Phycisphaerae bacterium]|nr:prepilin-type N-terminal cleavage/methylation domain-containing protein [Phycisphaerae bacterium]
MRETTTIRGSTSDACLAARRGYTLTEIVVVVGIISILLGIAIVSARAVYASRSRALATQQLATIAGAVERYASFWPRWEFGTIVVADKGWPDPFPFRAFNTGRYQAMPPFNTHVEYRVAGNGSGVIED